jgi:hypothetical protein
VQRTQTHIAIALLVLLGFGLGLWRCTGGEGIGRYTSDYYIEYLVAGERLVTGGTIVSPLIREPVPAEPSAMMPPAYIGLVAGLFELFGVRSYAAIFTLKFLNVLANALAVWVTFAVSTRMRCGWGRWIAAALVAANPLLIGFTKYIWDTSLFTVAVVISVWMASRLGEQRKPWWYWLAYGLWLGLVALLNPALTIGYPVLVLWPVTRIHGWRFQPIARAATLSLCGWAAVIGPWTVRNYAELGKLVYIRNGFALQLWLGVCTEADRHGASVFASQFPLMNDAAHERIASIGERRYLEECRQRSIDAIAADPLRYLKLVGIRAIDFFAGTVFTHAERGAGGWPKHPRRAVVMFFLLGESLIIMAGYVLIARRLQADVHWLTALIAVFSCVYLLTHVQIRFRSPIEPVFAIVLGAIIHQGYLAWAARRSRTAAR